VSDAHHDGILPMSPNAPPAARRRSPLRWLMHKQWRMSRSLTLGGQVCVIDTAGRVLLVRHGYRAGWHFPGGGVEFGETVADAAKREVREETGVEVTGELHLHGIFDNRAIFPGDHVVLFVAREFERHESLASGLEIAESNFFTRDNVPEGTTIGTRRRIGEIFDRQPLSKFW
jgi:8-oxo-dGTP pyrophosphatase MutT (NUDIX family)